MGATVEGLADTGRIADLRARGEFFWVDVPLSEADAASLERLLGIPPVAAAALLEARPGPAPSQRFYADGRHVAFGFSCFVAPDDGPYRPIDVGVLVTGEFLLTVHEHGVSLPQRLRPGMPDGRSEQYVVYAIVDAMLATAFDALNAVELILEQMTSTDLRSARDRMAALRATNSQLSGMRRRLAPQRGVFERVSEEIGRIEGLERDEERLFERVGDQLNRLVDAIDAAADGVAKLIDLRLNETMYWLTAVSTVFLPLTFLTGFFGMNFGWMVEHVRSPLAFLLLGVGGCVLAALATMYLVRRRGTPVEP